MKSFKYISYAHRQHIYITYAMFKPCVIFALTERTNLDFEKMKILRVILENSEIGKVLIYVIFMFQIPLGTKKSHGNSGS